MPKAQTYPCYRTYWHLCLTNQWEAVPLECHTWTSCLSLRSKPHHWPTEYNINSYCCNADIQCKYACYMLISSTFIDLSTHFFTSNKTDVMWLSATCNLQGGWKEAWHIQRAVLWIQGVRVGMHQGGHYNTRSHHLPRHQPRPRDRPTWCKHYRLSPLWNFLHVHAYCEPM